MLNMTGWTPEEQMWAICINPPQDTCPSFGACPNPDVTGYGQQASVFITEIVFSFLLAFWPEKIHSTIYAHSFLILSIQITATVALLRDQLTQNDGIFIIVLVSSPTTVFLWIMALRDLVTLRIFKTSGTVKFASTLTVLTLAAHCALALIMYIPSDYINFSQPACFPGYGREVLVETFWHFSFFLQILFAGLSMGIYYLFFNILGKPCTEDNIPDVVTWMEESIYDLAKSAREASSVLVPCCLAIIQLHPWFIWVPIPGILGACHLLICCNGIAWTLVRRRGFNSDFWIFLAMGVLSAASVGLPLLERLNVFPNIKLGTLANLALYPSQFIVFIVCTVSLWRRRRHDQAFRTFIYCALFSVPLAAAKFAGVGLAYLYVIHFRKSEAYSKDLSYKEHLKGFLLGSFSFSNLPWMFFAWLTTSQWTKQRGEQLTWKQIWQVTGSRAHLLKFGLLVVYPNALWISATIASNPTVSQITYSFGQFFAVIVSIGNIISVFLDFHQIKGEKWMEIILAIVQSRQTQWTMGEKEAREENITPMPVQPSHYRPFQLENIPLQQANQPFNPYDTYDQYSYLPVQPTV